MVFFFNDTATTEIYTLSLHDALPISLRSSWINIEKWRLRQIAKVVDDDFLLFGIIQVKPAYRSEEHTSELQSQSNLVCRLLLEKKKSEPSRPAALPASGGALSSAAAV